jgi:hypothetical protein
MDNNKKRPPRPKPTNVLAGLLIATAFAVAGIGLYTFYYQSAQDVDRRPVTLPR